MPDNDVLADLGAYLQTEGVGTLGTDLFLSWMPDSPDVVVALFETPGIGPSYVQGQDDPAYEFFSVQVRVRGNPENDYPSARTVAVSVDQALRKIANENVNGSYYLRVSKSNGPFTLQRDHSDRVVLAMNFDVVGG